MNKIRVTAGNGSSLNAASSVNCKNNHLQVRQLLKGTARDLMWMCVWLYLLHHLASLDIQFRAVTGC